MKKILRLKNGSNILDIGSSDSTFLNFFSNEQKGYRCFGIDPSEKKYSKYLEGIHCPKCHDHLTDDQKSRFAMRQKQIILAKKTGKRHIFKKEY